jgi:exocyst complex component 6
LTSTSFRSEREVEELWDSLVKGLTLAIENALRTETDPDAFFKVKETLIAFTMTLEVASFLISLSNGVN